MNVLTYARVSTPEQAERELSLPAQQQAMRDYASRQGWTIVDEFVEPGVTATTSKRPALQKLLLRCREVPKVDVVLVHKIDRFARNMDDHVSIKIILRQRGVRLASVVENVDDTISGQLVENIMASLAQFYSANLGEEVKKGMRQKTLRGGWPWRPPRGYVMSRDDAGRSIAIENPPEAAAVRRAFELYSSGSWSLNEIRHELAKIGFVTAGGQPVSAEAVRKMLHNPFYAGWVRWKDARYDGQHTPIVSRDLFEKVQAILEARFKDPGEKGKLHFWLRGVAICADCGTRMTAERHGHWSYYRCHQNVRSSRACQAPFVNVERADLAVERLLRRLRLSETLKGQLVAETAALVAGDVRTVKAEAAAVHTKRTALQEQERRLTAGYAQGDISIEAYRSSVAPIRAQLGAYEHQLTATRDPAERQRKLERILSVAESLWMLNGRLTGRARTQLLRLVFRKISIKPSGVVGYELNPPFDGLLSETPEGHGDSTRPGAGHLDQPQSLSANIDIFEFDDSQLLRLIKLADNRAA